MKLKRARRIASKLQDQLGFSKASKWGRIVRVLMYGTLFALYGLLNDSLRGRTLLDTMLDSFIFLLLGLYLALIISERCILKIQSVLSSRWRKLVGTLSFWLWSIPIWFLYLPLRYYLAQTPGINFSLADLIWLYTFFFLFLFTIVYSLGVYIPACQYLASLKITKEERKREIARSLTILTPMLGFPWIFAIYSILAFANIPITSYWWNYVIVFAIYAVIFIFFVDMPCSISINEKKKQDINELKRKRTILLEKIAKIQSNKPKDIWEKIALEFEIARIDREKQETESQTTHPFRIIIPVASFFLGIIGGLLIELLKELMKLA